MRTHKAVRRPLACIIFFSRSNTRNCLARLEYDSDVATAAVVVVVVAAAVVVVAAVDIDVDVGVVVVVDVDAFTEVSVDVVAVAGTDKEEEGAGSRQLWLSRLMMRGDAELLSRLVPLLLFLLDEA